jgi:hypothetical protein
MPSKPKVLFVLTSHSKLGDTGKPTGWYLVCFGPLILIFPIFSSSTQFIEISLFLILDIRHLRSPN